ncbi:uncharacterized protein G2W53_023242 [Senna tora]|uniref:Uncharacterized protein n=1 Tax=Senna tora TaxID=362788 RepID=A0A834TBF1_9FABA|nr:uncharacterized protein G2W53_023242 [Senna tora]
MGIKQDEHTLGKTYIRERVCDFVSESILQLE